MSKPTNDISFYNFNNLSSFVAQHNLKGIPPFRYLKDFVNTKLGMFGYKNLPEDSGLTTEIIETSIMFNNRLCFYKNETFGLILCRYLPNSDYDMYLKPKEVDLLAFNGKSLGRVPYKDIILVRDNLMDIIPFLTIYDYISYMLNIENTISKNVDICKLPLIFTGSKETVASFNQLIQKALDFKPFAITDKALVTDAVKTFDINFPVEMEELLSLYKNYRNLTVQSFGIYGIESQKRERLLQSEVQSQNDYVDYIYQQALDERRRFVKEVNDKYGYEIELVELYKEYREDDIEINADEAREIAKAESVGDSNETNV